MKFQNAFKFTLPAAALGILALGLSPMPANASTASATFTVSTTIAATCVLSTTPLSFGTYSGLILQATATGSGTCTNTTPYNVGLSAGLATGATVTTRRMTGPGGALLSYELFSDTGRTINWGTTIGTDTVASTGTGATQNFTVYGQIPAGQFYQSGVYNDTITVTVTW